MNDDQYRELKRMIAELGMRVEEMRLDAKRREELADHRFSLLYEWCAPDGYKVAVDAIKDIQKTDIPDDLRKFLAD